MIIEERRAFTLSRLFRQLRPSLAAFFSNPRRGGKKENSGIVSRYGEAHLQPISSRATAAPNTRFAFYPLRLAAASNPTW